jgi:hypothetical protein
VAAASSQPTADLPAAATAAGAEHEAGGVAVSSSQVASGASQLPSAEGAAAAGGAGVADATPAPLEVAASPTAAAAGKGEGEGTTTAAAAMLASAAPPAVATERYAVNTLQLVNRQHPPSWLRPQVAHPPPPPQRCSITGAPAKYCDPVTGHFYATPGAFQQLRAASGRPWALPPAPATLAATAAPLVAQEKAAWAAAAAAAGRGDQGAGGTHNRSRAAHHSSKEPAAPTSVADMPDALVALLLGCAQQVFGAGTAGEAAGGSGKGSRVQRTA